MPERTSHCNNLRTAAVSDCNSFSPAESADTLVRSGEAYNVVGDPAVTHHRRLMGLYGADRIPSIRYVCCDRPLVQEVDRLRRIITDEEITFGVF